MEDKELARKRVIVIAKAKAAAAAKAKAQQAEAKATEEQQLQDKYTKQSTEVQPSDPWDINPMAPSEVGLDVGTPEQKKALLRNVADGVLLGGAGEVEAAARSVMGQGSYGNLLDQIEMEQRQYEKAAPTASTVQELSGALMSPANLLRAPAAVQRAGQTAKTAYEVGLPAATYGFLGTEGDLGERAKGAATTGTIGVFGGVALNKVGNKLANLGKKNNTTPTTSSLKALRNEAYNKVDESQLFMNRQDMGELLNRASKVAEDKNYVTLPSAPTAVERVRKMIESQQGKALTLGQVEKLRRNIYRVANKSSDENSDIVYGIAKELDDMMDGIFAGSGDDAMKLARKANSDYRKAQTLEDAFSGVPKDSNTYTAYRKVAQKILNNKNQSRFFSDEEKALLEKFADGSVGKGTLNALGKFTPNANGLMGLFHIMAIGVNPYIALLSITGYGAKLLSDKSARNSADMLVKRMGGIDVVKELADNPSKATAVQAGLAEKINDIMFGPSEEGNAK